MSELLNVQASIRKRDNIDKYKYRALIIIIVLIILVKHGTYRHRGFTHTGNKKK